MSHPGGERDDHLQHHFDTPEQQYDSGKLGMWLFLATEVLLFGGLFCAYAIYRSNHPEIFIWGHEFLDKKMGAVNTVILLCSSLTMAWGVRAAQLGQRKLLSLLLSLTLLGGVGFMSIKYVEYKAKWEHGLLWAGAFNYGDHDEAAAESEHAAAEGEHAATDVDASAAGGEAAPAAEGEAPAQESAVAEELPAVDAADKPFAPEHTTQPPPAAAPSGRAIPIQAVAAHGEHSEAPQNAKTFFTIYFLMTGLHGLHVIAGMLAIAWVLRKALRGTFGPAYFTPVDLVGLYWHLVDLIWIFLFPLLYLIV